MKKATVRELRNHYTKLLKDIRAGEEILITRHGIAVAKLVPVKSSEAHSVDWENAPEVARDRGNETIISSNQAEEILKESGGKW